MNPIVGEKFSISIINDSIRFYASNHSLRFFLKRKLKELLSTKKRIRRVYYFSDDSVVESWYRFAGRFVELMETRKGRGGHDNDREARGEEDRMIQATEKGK